MGARQKRWARSVRDSLHAALGNKCVDCEATADLQLDCITPQGADHHRRMDWSARMSFYRKQYAAGNLALRCKLHNGLKGADDKRYHQLVGATNG